MICDEAVSSDIEYAVFDLEGVRERIVADSFPHWHSLNVFLMLVYFRGGAFRGMARVVEEGTDEVIREVSFQVAIDPEDDGVLLSIELGSCIFPRPGKYTGEVWFYGSKGQYVQKGQRTLFLIQGEDSI